MDDKQFDGTFGNKRPLDVQRLVRLAKLFNHEYKETGILSLRGERGASAGVYIEACALSQVAPTSEWVWQGYSTDDDWRASTIIAGVEFFALFTDEEKQAVLNGK